MAKRREFYPECVNLTTNRVLFKGLEELGEITVWLDIQGDPTDDAALAKTCVVKLPDNAGFAKIDVRSFARTFH